MADLNNFDYFNKFNAGFNFNGASNPMFSSSAFDTGFNSFMPQMQSLFDFSTPTPVNLSEIKDISAFTHNFFFGDNDFMSQMMQFQMPSFLTTLYPSFNTTSGNYPPFKSKSCDRNLLINRFNGAFKGNLAGKGAAIVSTAEKYGIDPALFASILANESGYGKYGSGNNFGGLMDPKTGHMSKQKFATVEQGLDRVAANLYKNYISKGLTTPATIGPKYCPVGASNDPNNLNANWIPGVTKVYNKFTA